MTDADLDFFRSVVGPSHVKTSDEDLERFNTDWMKKYRGHSPAAVLPGTTEQVSRVLRHCNERGIAVVPQGGNTGLVGGSVPVGRVGEVVLSTSRMNAVGSFDPLSGVLVCEVLTVGLVWSWSAIVAGACSALRWFYLIQCERRGSLKSALCTYSIRT